MQLSSLASLPEESQAAKRQKAQKGRFRDHDLVLHVLQKKEAWLRRLLRQGLKLDAGVVGIIYGHVGLVFVEAHAVIVVVDRQHMRGRAVEVRLPFLVVEELDNVFLPAVVIR